MNKLDIVQIVIGFAIASVALRFAVKHAEKITSSTVEKLFRFTSDYGIGVFTGLVASLCTRSVLTPLILVGVLYGAQKIKLSQASYVIAGAVIGATFTGVPFLIVRTAHLCAIVLVVTAVARIILHRMDREKKAPFTMMLFSIGVSLGGFILFREGFHDLWGEFFRPILYSVLENAKSNPLLPGMFTGFITQSTSVSLGVLISLSTIMMITPEFSLQIVSSVGLFAHLFTLVPLMIAHTRNYKIALSIIALYLLVMISSAALHPYAYPLFKELFTTNALIITAYFTLISITGSLLFIGVTAVGSVIQAKRARDSEADLVESEQQNFSECE